MRSRDARDVTSAPCALSKLRSREKKKRKSRGGEVWRRGVPPLERYYSPANRNETRQKLGRGLGKGEGGRGGVTESRFTDCPSVKWNPIL